jgi:hypothetical protein
MNTDRTTKLLLAAIALALWGLLLRPAFTPIPTRAAEADSDHLVVTGEGQATRIYLYGPGARVFRFDPNDLSVKASASFDVAKDTFANHVP